MPVPSALLGLPQIAGSDTPDIPRDLNAVISRFETLRNVFATRQILDVGMTGQIRAGRPLTVADFTGIGLSTPILLANLSTLAGVGSNLGSGGNLTNKGAVVNAPGIMGAAAEAAQFAGAAAQALYIPDAGAGDPFRIRTGYQLCWFRTAKRGVTQYMLGKYQSTDTPATSLSLLGIGTTNTIIGTLNNGTTAASMGTTSATTDVVDDRWHFAVSTYDGTVWRIYLDGALEYSTRTTIGPLNAGGASAPFNIGGYGADAATNAVSPFYGRVDEVAFGSDILSEDQVRYLYCASLLHTLPVLPQRAQLLVRRMKRGAPLVSADFPATPNRNYNFPAGSLANEGSDANGAAGTTATLALNAGTGAIVPVAGPDGAKDGAYSFSGAHTGLSATDTGLPAGTAARTYEVWFKTTGTGAQMGLMGWGTAATAEAMLVLNSAGSLRTDSGADVINSGVWTDGLWHHAVVVEDNAAADAKRKLYADARLLVGSTVLNAITLVGANGLRIGAQPGATQPFVGQLARPAVFAGALTAEQVRALFLKGTQALSASPKAAEDHIEAFEPVRALVVFDALEPSDQIDLMVTA